MICEFCKNIFKTKSSLNNHKINAKYCLKIRNQVNETLRCKGCKKVFGSKQWLTMHYNKCPSNIKNTLKMNNQLTEKNKELQTVNDMLENQIEEYKHTIQQLQDKLENIALKAVSRPTTSNKTQINNYIQQMQPLTDKHFTESVSNLTLDHIKKGAEGYAAYALEYPLKDRIICSDYSRRKVKFKDENKNVITDPEMMKLSQKFFNSIKERNKELICESANELKERLGDENIMDTVVKMFDYKLAVDKGSDGETTEFQLEFVKQICSKSLKE
jgi:hypothetical protein